MIQSSAGLTRLESITNSFFQDLSQKRYLYTPIKNDLGILHINHNFTFQFKKEINIGLFNLTQTNSYVNIQPMYMILTILQDVNRPVQQLLIQLFPIEYAKLLEDSCYYRESLDKELEKQLQIDVMKFINKIQQYCKTLSQEQIKHAISVLQDNIKTQEQLLSYEKIIVDSKLSNQINFSSMLIIMFLTPFGRESWQNVIINQNSICILGEGEYLISDNNNGESINYFINYIKVEEELFKERGQQFTDFNLDLNGQYVEQEYNQQKSNNFIIEKNNQIYKILVNKKPIYELQSFKNTSNIKITNQDIILPFNCKQFQYIDSVVSNKDFEGIVELNSDLSQTDIIITIIKQLQQ